MPYRKSYKKRRFSRRTFKKTGFKRRRTPYPRRRRIRRRRISSNPARGMVPSNIGGYPTKRLVKFRCTSFFEITGAATSPTQTIRFPLTTMNLTSNGLGPISGYYANSEPYGYKNLALQYGRYTIIGSRTTFQLVPKASGAGLFDGDMFFGVTKRSVNDGGSNSWSVGTLDDIQTVPGAKYIHCVELTGPTSNRSLTVNVNNTKLLHVKNLFDGTASATGEGIWSQEVDSNGDVSGTNNVNGWLNTTFQSKDGVVNLTAGTYVTSVTDYITVWDQRRLEDPEP